MEKYGSWRDAGTGIQPFLPPKPPRTYVGTGEAVLNGLLTYLLGPILALLRLLLIVIVSLWLFLMTFLGNLIPVPILRRGFVKYVSFLGARAILFFMGFWWIPTSYSSTKKGRSEASPDQWPPGGGIKSGDVIICNHTSYTEILYLVFRFAPIFTECFVKNGKDSADGLVRPLSAYQAITTLFGVPSIDASKHKDAVKLTELSKKAKAHNLGPIIVFPEATTTNGKTILKFSPVLEKLGRDVPLHLIGFRFNDEKFSPTYTAGSGLRHFLVLCSQPSNSLEVRYIPSSEMSSLLAEASASPSLTEPIANALANVLRVKRAGLSVEDKVAFLAYFNERKKGYKAE